MSYAYLRISQKEADLASQLSTISQGEDEGAPPPKKKAKLKGIAASQAQFAPRLPDMDFTRCDFSSDARICDEHAWNALGGLFGSCLNRNPEAHEPRSQRFTNAYRELDRMGYLNGEDPRILAAATVAADATREQIMREKEEEERRQEERPLEDDEMAACRGA